MRFVRGLLVLAGILGLGVGVASAQTTIGAGVKLGIDFAALPNAGEVLDQVIGQPSVETSSKVGVLGGGFVQFGFTDRFSFQPELMFVMKGVKLDEGPNNGNVTAAMNYIEFPLLFRFQARSDVRTLYGAIGPSFGLKASTSAKRDNTSQTVDIDIDHVVRTVDTGLTFVGGLERSRYLIEARFTLGLTDVMNDVFPHTDSIKSRVLAIMAGVRFK